MGLAGPVYLNTDNRGQEATSSDTHRRVDAEVTRMLREAYSRVTTLLVLSCYPLFMHHNPPAMSYYYVITMLLLLWYYVMVCPPLLYCGEDKMLSIPKCSFQFRNVIPTLGI